MKSGNSALLLSTFSTEPVYNVKAICVRTGITAATLRAWERRYGMPSPNRSAQGYRLYSERDMAILFWLKEQTEGGMSIGQAVQQLTAMLSNGHDPLVHVSFVIHVDKNAAPRSPEIIARDLYNALLALDERSAEYLLNEALALYTLETTLVDVLRYALEMVQEAREQGDTTLSTDRFAINFARQRLRSMMQNAQAARNGRSIVTIGFPGEHSEVDLSIIGLLMRRHSWPVIHLGTDIDPTLFQEALKDMDAGMVLYYADLPQNAEKLAAFSVPLNPSGHKVLCICGGRALQDAPALREKIPFEYVGADLRAIVHALLGRVSQEYAIGAGVANVQYMNKLKPSTLSLRNGITRDNSNSGRRFAETRAQAEKE